MKRGVKTSAAFLMAAIMLLTACGSKAKATTMHLRKTEGEVSVSDEKRKEVALAEELGLYNGYRVDTQEESYAWIDLDSVKLTKMDADSRVEIQKDGKELEIVVKSGSLFFHVTEPLEDDETMNIRTSDLVVGIRGTCGWVDEEQGLAALLEGKVRCKTRDGERVTISAGEKAVLGSSGELVVTPLTVQDIPDFVREELEEDEELYEQIEEDTGLDTLAPPPPQIRSGQAVTIAKNSTAEAVIMEDGTLWMRGWGVWGNNSTAFREAHGSTDEEHFVQVMENVTAVCLNGERAGGSDVPNSTTAVIDGNGTLWMWGDGDLGDGIWSWRRTSGEFIRTMDNVAAVSMGHDFTAVLQKDGSLWTWGYGYPGNGVDLNMTFDISPTPIKIMDDVASVSTSGYTTAAVKTDGSLWMWGSNHYGQLGTGAHDAELFPVKVMDDVSAVCVSPDHTAAIKTDGTLWTWGLNDCGQIGNGGGGDSTVPEEYAGDTSWDYDTTYTAALPVQTRPIQVMEHVSSVYTSLTSTMAVLEDGSLWRWGISSQGNASSFHLELVDRTYGHEVTVQNIPKKIADGAAGVTLQRVLKTDGSLWALEYDSEAMTKILDGAAIPEM
ncbi:FecR domain-containing protein [Lachnospiraceae bacterium 62-35]